MKNDFREFYDEDYILHTAVDNTDDEYIAHGKLLNAIHKYIDKFKNRKGKWVYVYPDNNGSMVWGREQNRLKAYEDAYGKANRDYQYRKENQKSGQGLYNAQLAKDKKKNAYTYGYEKLQRDTRARHQGNANALAQQNKNNSGYTYGYEQLQRDTRAQYQKEANRRMAQRQNAMKGDSRYSGKSSKSSDYARTMNNQFKKNTAARSAMDSAYVSGRNRIGSKQSDYSRVMNAQEASRKAALKEKRRREKEKQYAKYAAGQKKKARAAKIRRSLAAPFR